MKETLQDPYCKNTHMHTVEISMSILRTYNIMFLLLATRFDRIWRWIGHYKDHCTQNKCRCIKKNTHLFKVLRQCIFWTKKVGYTFPIQRRDHHQSHCHCHEDKCHHGCDPRSFFFCKKKNQTNNSRSNQNVFDFNLLLLALEHYDLNLSPHNLKYVG